MEEPEDEVESILRSRAIRRRSRGTYRQALDKWVSEVDLTWEPVESVQDTKALDTIKT